MSNDCGIPLKADLELKAKDGTAALELQDKSARMAAFAKFQDQISKLPSKDFWDVSTRVMELFKCDLPKVDIHDGDSSNKTSSERDSKNDFHRHQTVGQKVEALDKNVVKLTDQLKEKASFDLETEGVLPKTSFSDMTDGYHSTAADPAFSKKLQMIDKAMSN
jgi:hypothetical protein